MFYTCSRSVLFAMHITRIRFNANIYYFISYTIVRLVWYYTIIICITLAPAPARARPLDISALCIRRVIPWTHATLFETTIFSLSEPSRRRRRRRSHTTKWLAYDFIIWPIIVPNHNNDNKKHLCTLDECEWVRAVSRNTFNFLFFFSSIPFVFHARQFFLRFGSFFFHFTQFRCFSGACVRVWADGRIII